MKMEIEYTEYSIPNPEEILRNGLLENFLVDNPPCGLLISRGHMFPPLSALNELLSKGKYDAGMGGAWEWTPFQITAAEHSALKQKTEKLLEVNLSGCLDETMSFKKWRSYALKNSKNKRS